MALPVFQTNIRELSMLQTSWTAQLNPLLAASTSFISSNPAAKIAVGASGVYVPITSILLTAGDWEVQGTLALETEPTTAATSFSGGISLSKNSTDVTNSGGFIIYRASLPTSLSFYNPTGTRIISVPTPTATVYLIGALGYSVGGGAVWLVDSFISARRVA